MNKTESLTPAQEQNLIEYREEWLAIGRSTERADRPACETVFKQMYKALGKKEPKVWWWDGPATGSMARTILKNANLWANLGDNLRDNLGDNLRANLWANLRDNLRANLRDNLRYNLRDNLWANLWANLGDNLGDNLRDNLRANLRDNLSWYFWGQHESAWPAFYFWPHKTLKPMHTEEQLTKLSWWMILSKSCGWWEPFENAVFVCERPIKQAVDGRGRLHCTDGPALLCRDTWPMYAVHGIRVPADIVENPESITVKRINTETNAEVRRVMIERFGFDKYLYQAKIKQVQQDDFGRLYRKELPSEPAMQFVRVVNSSPEPDGTFREYVLPVRNTVKSAHEAVASSFGLSVDQYQPIFES